MKLPPTASTPFAKARLGQNASTRPTNKVLAHQLDIATGLAHRQQYEQVVSWGEFIRFLSSQSTPGPMQCPNATMPHTPASIRSPGKTGKSGPGRKVRTGPMAWEKLGIPTPHPAQVGMNWTSLRISNICSSNDGPTGSLREPG